jgi:hypothetical protein
MRGELCPACAWWPHYVSRLISAFNLLVPVQALVEEHHSGTLVYERPFSPQISQTHPAS